MKYVGQVCRKKAKNGRLFGPYLNILNATRDFVHTKAIDNNIRYKTSIFGEITYSSIQKQNIVVIDHVSLKIENRTFAAICGKESFFILHDRIGRWNKLYQRFNALSSRNQHLPLIKFYCQAGEWFWVKTIRIEEVYFNSLRETLYKITCQKI